MSKQKIDSLTSLRFFAAAAIVAYHARGHFGLPLDFLAPFELSQGVSFFFVLSGFILAFVYPDLNAAGAKFKFWRARFARIWPVHVVSIVLFVLLVNEYRFAGLGPLFANLALVQSCIPWTKWFFSYNAVAWSISTEAFFYLVFPFLITNFDKTWPAKLGVCFLLVLALIGLTNWLHLPVLSDTAVSGHWMLYVNPLARLFEFVLGMTVAHFYRKYLADRKAGLIVGSGCELIALATLFLLTAKTVKISNWLCRLPYVQEGARMWLEHGGVPAFAFALLIAVMAWGRGPISRVLSLRGFVLLGEISFSMYLVHRIFLHFYWEHFSPEHGLVPMAIYGVSILAASYVCWSLIEVPCRHLIVNGPARMPKPNLAGGLALAFSLLLLPLVWVGIWSGPELERIDQSAVKAELDGNTTGGTSGDTVAGPVTDPTRLVAPAGAKRCDIAFGDNLLLLGTRSVPDESGLKVTLYWQALRDQQIDYNVSLRLLTDKNVLVRIKGIKQSYREEWVDKGECFKNEILVPASEMQYVQRLAIRPYGPVGASPDGRLAHGAAGSVGAEIFEGRATVDVAPGLLATKAAKPAGPAL